MAAVQNRKGPLSGYRVVELAGIGPGPYCGRLLADMGAELIVVDRAGLSPPMIDDRGKQSIVLDLRKAEAVEAVMRLVETADVLIEGFRPGVTEKLGVGPLACHERNPKLVYGRMTGWGQTGPWSKMAGHDLNYLSITGFLKATGEKGKPPPPPLNLVGDYGGGSLFLAMGILASLLQVEKTGKGDIVDAAIIDGVSSMMGIIHSMNSLGQWSRGRQSNLLDSGAPFYRCYETSDAEFMAVGCIEPKFFALMLEIIKVSPIDFGEQNDTSKWPQQHKVLEEVFVKKSRQEWSDLFNGTDACVTPVLDYLEAPEHPQNAARLSHSAQADFLHPAAAPRFSRSIHTQSLKRSEKGGDTEIVLRGLGFSEAEIQTLMST